MSLRVKKVKSNSPGQAKFDQLSQLLLVYLINEHVYGIVRIIQAILVCLLGILHLSNFMKGQRCQHERYKTCALGRLTGHHPAS